MNRFEKVAARITHKHGVSVRWIPQYRRYAVDGAFNSISAPAYSARHADSLAAKAARVANNGLE